MSWRKPNVAVSNAMVTLDPTSVGERKPQGNTEEEYAPPAMEGMEPRENKQSWQDPGFDKALPPLPLFGFDHAGGDGGYSRSGNRISSIDYQQQQEDDGEYSGSANDFSSGPPVIKASGRRSQAKGPPPRPNRDSRPPPAMRGFDLLNGGKGKTRPITRPGGNRSSDYYGDIPMMYVHEESQRKDECYGDTPMYQDGESQYQDPQDMEPPMSSKDGGPRVIRRQQNGQMSSSANDNPRGYDRQNMGTSMGPEPSMSSGPSMGSSNGSPPVVRRGGGTSQQNPSDEMPRPDYVQTRGGRMAKLEPSLARQPQFVSQSTLAHKSSTAFGPYEARYGDDRRHSQEYSGGGPPVAKRGETPIRRIGLGFIGNLFHKEESEESFACVSARNVERGGNGFI